MEAFLLANIVDPMLVHGRMFGLQMVIFRGEVFNLGRMYMGIDCVKVATNLLLSYYHWETFAFILASDDI